MKLFFKGKEMNAHQGQTALSRGMQAGYRRLQEGWANWMIRHTGRFSRRTWIVVLLLFVLSVSAFCVYVSINAITGKDNLTLTVTPIRKPEYATKTGTTPIDAAKLSEGEYSRIRKFRLYMDSLARSPSGKFRYDSITSHRPGLMDSVRFIENYYQQLKQNQKWKRK